MEELYCNIHKKLCLFFQTMGRQLPWRSQNTPYAVWISEVMLQQTQVITVIPYFKRWMERFPDVYSLANANQEEIFALWAGLGYYRRAANLHNAAQQIVTEYQGSLPTTCEELLKIKGIGDYTAGAIASFAFNQNVPAIDANVERVLSRIFGILDDIHSKKGAQILKNHALNLAKEGNAKITSQAMMDLGASFCGKIAKCEQCPLTELCYAYKHQCANNIPKKGEKIVKSLELRSALALQNSQDEYLIVRRKNEGLLGGLWTFPMITLYQATNTEKNNADFQRIQSAPTITRWETMFEELKINDKPNWRTLIRLSRKNIKHTFTHIQMHICLDHAHCDAPQFPTPQNLLPLKHTEYDMATFVALRDIPKFGISTLMKKILQTLRKV